MGEIQQETYIALEDLCNMRKVFKDYLHGDRRLDNACNDSHIKIKYGKDKSCYCPTRKKKHFGKLKKFPPKIPKRRKYKWRYLKKKKKSSRFTKSARCYICNQKGHYAKSCPNNKKGAKMIQQIQQKSGIRIPEEDDLESLFSIDDEPNEQSLCAIQSVEYSDSKSSSNEILMAQSQTHSHSLLSNVQSLSTIEVLVPHIPVSIYLEKYSKPIIVIAFIDTEAAEIIMNLDVLPPGLTTTVLGSKLPRKDLIVGFNLYTKAKHLRILPEGLRYKKMFKPFVPIPKLFSVYSEKIQEIIEELRKKSCAESHSEFLQKCQNPLWKNSEFFIKLPFKKNEDINLKKASHMRMNPDHLKLAEAECRQLQNEGLIEVSDSQWACEAFYVNKRSEQARGKLRLVINYQPLNYFLQDDKFPLPNRNSIFSSLTKSRVFSKFDLKAGFWQLGIDPEDRPKTGFCIPNKHFQWTVMPFGLKTGPSLFQKAMIKIFQPIMDQTLIYIDDILLYSPD
ncbi:uncharacterized protein LOC105762241 [Gossypium raimondii]|uniref:uncharacterized protein LOC105762241 n=1 Tax=Gossypium raimondii TaxID=29730 RepID=UPI00063AD6C0|nr:uncharacterized protein LOC105762241 [Gossypium raimondii]